MSQNDSSESPTSLRQLNIEARRQRILAAARELIAAGGLEALSMRKLAKHAGLSVTTLYNLFGVRDEIVQALVLDAIDQMDLLLEQEAPLDDPIERCRAIVTVSIRIVTGDEAVFRPMVIGAMSKVGTAGSAGEVTRRAASMQAVAIRAAIDQGLLKGLLDPEQLGRQIYHGYEYASFQWARGVIDAKGFETRARYGLEVVLLGIASRKVRPQIETELARLEAEMSSASRVPHETEAQRRNRI